MIYDDHQGRAIGELSFRNNVRPCLACATACTAASVDPAAGAPLAWLHSCSGWQAPWPLSAVTRNNAVAPTRCLQVRAVKLRKDRIAVALEHKVRWICT